jgi:DNA primase large subunit
VPKFCPTAEAKLNTATNASPPNRVFEHVHALEIKKVKDDGTWTSAQLETIVHPNEYFKRSYLLKNLGKAPKDGIEGDVVVKGEAMEE